MLLLDGVPRLREDLGFRLRKENGRRGLISKGQSKYRRKVNGAFTLLDDFFVFQFAGPLISRHLYKS